MGKKAPKAPASPDPYATAQAQGQANAETARINQAASMVNQYTPYGSLEYSPLGNDRWAATQTLSPAQQTMLNQENALGMQMGNIAGQQLGQVGNTLATPFSTAGMQQAGGVVNYQDPRAVAAQQYGASRGKILEFQDPRVAAASQYAAQSQWGKAPVARDTEAVRQAMLGRMQPQMDQQQQGIRNQLLNSGVREGTEAWNRSMDDYNRQANDMQLAATLAAGQEQQRLFGQDLEAANFQDAQRQRVLSEIGGVEAQQQGIQDRKTGNYQDILNEISALEQRGQTYQDRLTAERQRQMSEAAYLRQLPMNEISALMSSQQIQQPNWINAPAYNQQAAPIADTAYQSYAGQTNAYNQQMQQAMANRAGFYGLLGSGIGAFGNWLGSR